jgi:hypothetical protein
VAVVGKGGQRFMAGDPSAKLGDPFFGGEAGGATTVGDGGSGELLQVRFECLACARCLLPELLLRLGRQAERDG